MLSLLDLLDKGLEDRRIFQSELRQHFAVESNILLTFKGNESSVGNTVQTERRIEAGNPQTAESALLGASVTAGVFASLDDGFLGLGKQILTTPAETFGRFEDVLVALFGHDATLDSGHIRIVCGGLWTSG